VYIWIDGHGIQREQENKQVVGNRSIEGGQAFYRRGLHSIEGGDVNQIDSNGYRKKTRQEKGLYCNNSFSIVQIQCCGVKSV